ncbi:hypothetical protein ACFQZ4_24040 [Catellatospora coxensis]|uniref:Uncharacterized protein n=1 Tax=Catellatospora coxensis TaxID=310354 RepID=A0A8J3PB93_9ACTN|nr:hypothetical protein [Catellatospora coxensis]GIG10188.1 hypothetical protein Cco03nite_68880 [Catellatospora coxensis]
MTARSWTPAPASNTQVQHHGTPDAVCVGTDVPGAVVATVELAGGVVAQLNGAGSIVAFIYPHGLEDL